MKKILVLMMALIMILSLAACGGDDTPEPEVANPAVSDGNVEDWNYKDVTPEQIQALADIVKQMEPLYNEAVSAAKENGWEADELTVQELNTVYVMLDAAIHGVADPGEYEGTEDMDAVVESYQLLLDAMPDLINKVSAPYGE